MSSSILRRALPAALALLLLPPAAASAATLAYAPDGTLVYTLTDGADGPTIDPQGPGEPVILDDVSPITSAPGGCWVGGGMAVCQVSEARGVRVELLGGDDEPVILDSPRVLPIALSGGAGNDSLIGRNLAGGGETLLGGDGDDALSGEGGADVLDGGAGNDKLVGDGLSTARGGDVLEGGPGHDTVEDWSLTASSGPIAVTIGAGADDGFAGEGDDVRGVEAVWTSSPGRIVGTDAAEQLFASNGAVTLEGRGGDDELRGADDADVLDGGAGADRLVGGAGDDRLAGGPGPDRISADVATELCGTFTCKPGSGNDVVDARDGEVDSVDCGAGTDRVLADAGDVVAADCEQVERTAAPTPPPGPAPKPGPTPPGPTPHDRTTKPRVAIARTSLRSALAKGLRVTLTGLQPGRRTVTVTTGKRRLATATARVGSSGRATVRVRFGKAAKRALKGKRKVVLVVRAGGARTTLTLKR